MAEELKDIDTSPVEELTEIKIESDRLEEYRQRAERMKQKVDALVYRRVCDDYQERQKALESRAKPLKARARGEYQKLSALHQRVSTAFEEARLAKEELEFRHAVGELDEDSLAESVQEPEARLAEREAELAEIDACRQRFLSVVASEKELVGVTSEAEAEPATRLQAPATGRKAAARETPAAEEENPNLATNLNLVVETPPAPPEEPADRTFLVPDARLVPVDDSTDGAEFRLGMVSSIGRSAENQIRLVKAGVSRRHAVIKLTERGFVIQDLESQNGTFINGERVPEHTLSDGDLIWIGDVKMAFKTNWTPPAAGHDAEAESNGGDQGKQARRGRRS